MKLAILATAIVGAAAFTNNSPAFSRQETALGNQKKKIDPALKKKDLSSKIQYMPCISTKDLPKPGSATSGVAGGLAICIAMDNSGSLYALGDKCPPVNQPLSFGRVREGTIEDPVLGTKFSLKTGDVVGPWCPSGLGKLIGGLFDPLGVPTYSVRTRGGSVEVQVDVNYKDRFESNYWAGVLDAQGKADGKYY